jgi:hypothetical protein
VILSALLLFAITNDPHPSTFKGDLTKALDMELTHPGPTEEKGLWGRCKRHAIYAINGEIKAIRVAEAEDDPAGDANPEVTLAESMLEAIQAVKAAREGE